MRMCTTKGDGCTTNKHSKEAIDTGWVNEYLNEPEAIHQFASSPNCRI
jgi:hypothetical protein